jgi:hypothetical protein
MVTSMTGGTTGLLQVLELVDDSLWMPNLDWAAVLMGAERRVCGGFAGSCR